jgi:hypothetical protein
MLPSTNQLARQFSRYVRAALSKHQLLGAISENKGRYAATNDDRDAISAHVDPWVIMHDAWTHLGAPTMRIDNHEHTRICEAAARLSKKHEHDPDQIPLA